MLKTFKTRLSPSASKAPTVNLFGLFDFVGKHRFGPRRQLSCLKIIAFWKAPTPCSTACSVVLHDSSISWFQTWFYCMSCRIQFVNFENQATSLTALSHTLQTWLIWPSWIYSHNRLSVFSFQTVGRSKIGRLKTTEVALCQYRCAKVEPDEMGFNILLNLLWICSLLANFISAALGFLANVYTQSMDPLYVTRVTYDHN